MSAIEYYINKITIKKGTISIYIFDYQLYYYTTKSVCLTGAYKLICSIAYYSLKSYKETFHS